MLRRLWPHFRVRQRLCLIGNERIRDNRCDLAKFLRIKTFDAKNLDVGRLRSKQIGERAAVFEFIPPNTANRIAAEHRVKNARLQRADVGDKLLIRLQRSDRALPHPPIPIAKINVDAAQPEKARAPHISEMHF